MTLSRKAFAATIVIVLMGSQAVSQTPPAVPGLTPIEAPSQSNAIPLLAAPPSVLPKERWNRLGEGRIVRNVSQPTITPFLPDPTKASGAAVIVAPGGGFKFLSMDSEGYVIAQWLADHGVAAFVLKYRLNPMPDGDQEFGQAAMRMFMELAANPGKVSVSEPRATQDAVAALAYVRSNASKFRVDRERVGMIGFSAGAITTLNSVLEAKPAERPAFIGYIYGPMTAVTVPEGAPPMFAALSVDDDLFGGQGYGIVEAWRKARRPVELHAYEKGGHGFGPGKPGTTSTGLLDQFLAWMRSRELLGKN